MQLSKIFNIVKLIFWASNIGFIIDPVKHFLYVNTYTIMRLNHRNNRQ